MIVVFLHGRLGFFVLFFVVVMFIVVRVSATAKWLVEKAGCFEPVYRLTGQIISDVTLWSVDWDFKPYSSQLNSVMYWAVDSTQCAGDE